MKPNDIETGVKRCRRCDVVKPHSEYTRAKRTPDGLDLYCRPCKSAMQKKTYYQTYTPEQQRARQLKKKYGLSLECFDKLVEAQKGACAICGDALDLEHKNATHVDHCHKGGHVRGVLCRQCNVGLGHFKDNIDSLRAAINYLEGTA